MKLSTTVTVSRKEVLTFKLFLANMTEIAGQYLPKELHEKLVAENANAHAFLSQAIKIDVEAKGTLSKLAYAMKLKDELTVEVTLEVSEEVLDLFLAAQLDLHIWMVPMLKAAVGVYTAVKDMGAKPPLGPLKAFSKIEEGCALTSVKTSSETL